jgi:hypothetical protein
MQEEYYFSLLRDVWRIQSGTDRETQRLTDVCLSYIVTKCLQAGIEE